MDIIVKCKKRIYKSDKGWCVYSFTDNDDKEITVTGEIEAVPNRKYVVTGDFFNHAKYGRTFRALDIREDGKPSPESEEGMIAFLAKEIKCGIGPVTARRIVETFGTDTFRVIETDPEQLLSIKGVKAAKLPEIIEKFNSDGAAKTRRLYIALAPYGFTQSQIVKIGQTYGTSALSILRDNPYKTYEDIKGIGFIAADRMAKNLGVPFDAPIRVRAAILYTLENAAIDGHTYITGRMLSARLGKIIEKNPIGDIEPYIKGLIKDNLIVRTDEGFYYRADLYRAENDVAYHIKRLKNAGSFYNFDATGSLEEIEKEIRKTNSHFRKFDELQKTAVLNAAGNTVSVITGGPGTGKTSTIIGLIKALQLKSPDISIVLCAPTGKAAKRMTQQTGLPAYTISRLLAAAGFNEDSVGDGDFDGDVFIVDESSMIDISQMKYFLEKIPTGTKLIFIGDTDQLPSIGPGTCLEDIIRSETVPTVYLDKIYRQEGECGIIMTSQRIKMGDKHIIEDSSLQFIPAEDDQKAFNIAMAGYKQLLDKGISPSDIEILAPFRSKRLIAADNLNNHISQTFNHSTESYNYGSAAYPKTIKVWDRVVHTKNDYNMPYYETEDGSIPKPGAQSTGQGIFNGDTGTVVSVSNPEHETNGMDEHLITVQFDDGKFAFYDPTQLKELDLSFATTVHKSQGSEYPIVIIPVLKSQSFFLQRNLLYTAITRAAKKCYIIGQREAYCMAVTKNEASERKSDLARKLREPAIMKQLSFA